MKWFINIIQAILGLFRKSEKEERVGGPQDAAEITPDLTEMEVADRDSVGQEEVIIEEALEDLSSSLPSAGDDNDDTTDATPETPRDGVVAHVPRYLWCLDNGHGKSTPGKRSGTFGDGSQLFEYEFNRGVNHFLMQRLDAIGVQYYNVVPEVEGDVSLNTRVTRANGKSTDLPGGKIYVSIHANANGMGGWDSQNVRGIETWFYGGSWRSKLIASAFHRELIQEMGWKDRFLKYRTPYSKSFYVLRKTSMPAILLENGFYSSQADAELLRRDEVRQQMAEAYVKAILAIEKDGIASIETYPTIYKYS